MSENIYVKKLTLIILGREYLHQKYQHQPIRTTIIVIASLPIHRWEYLHQIYNDT